MLYFLYMNIEGKRQLNEKKFSNWENLPDGGRRYWLEVEGRHGWKARYVKEVNSMEETVKFYQEVYDGKGDLIEIHEKFPVNKSHRKLKEG
ncbi:MAG: hypothetical protein AB1488_00805 [Nitrospirota bacterium]